MNLEEVINDPELEEIIDLDTIPNPNDDPFAYEFFVQTVEAFKEEKKQKERGYAELGKIEFFGVSISPLVFAMHEYLHALGAKLVGAEVGGFGCNSWGLYTMVYGDSYQVAFSSLFPHLIAFPAFYYTFFKRKIFALPFVAPTLAELFPYELFGEKGDFLVAAENLFPHYSEPMKYVLLGVWFTAAYFSSRIVYRRNLKSKEINIDGPVAQR